MCMCVHSVGGVAPHFTSFPLLSWYHKVNMGALLFPIMRRVQCKHNTTHRANRKGSNSKSHLKEEKALQVQLVAANGKGPKKEEEGGE